MCTPLLCSSEDAAGRRETKPPVAVNPRQIGRDRDRDRTESRWLKMRIVTPHGNWVGRGSFFSVGEKNAGEAAGGFADVAGGIPLRDHAGSKRLHCSHGGAVGALVVIR